MEDLSAMLKKVSRVADSVELSRESSQELEIASQRKEVQVSDSSIDQYVVRVISSGRLGVVDFYRPEDLEKSTRLAVVLAKHAEKLDMEFPSPGRPQKSKTYDKRVANMGARDLRDSLDSMCSTVDKKTEALESDVYRGISLTEVANTNGIHLSESRTLMAASISSKVKGKEGIGERFESSRFKFDPSAFGKDASKDALSQASAKPIKAGKYRVVFDRNAVGMFWGMFMRLFDGSSVANSQSYLYDKLGNKLFGNDLDITDTPFEVASSSRSFDDEGTPSRDKKLVERGTVRNFLFSSEWLAKAKKRKIKRISSQTAGAADGGSNLTVRNGDIKDLTEDGGVILIKSFLGYNSFNGATGDFGIVADMGFCMKRGEIIHPINGVAINANIFGLLKYPLLERKSFVKGSLISPRIGFDSVTCV